MFLFFLPRELLLLLDKRTHINVNLCDRQDAPESDAAAVSLSCSWPQGHNWAALVTVFVADVHVTAMT